MEKKTVKTKKKAVSKKPTKETVKKVEGVFKIFLNKKSSFPLEKGEYPLSKIDKNPDLFFDSLTDAQNQAKHWLDEQKEKLTQDEYKEIFYRIENFS
tara:strand:+ start:298 stop:588 length:291 start_codon:yes stop_codon:yes gene_type:complete